MAEQSALDHPRVTWRAAWIVVGLYLAVVTAAAALLPCPDPETHGTRLAVCLLAIEVLGIGIAAPFLAARELRGPVEPGGRAGAGAGARWLAVLVPLVGMAVVSAAVVAAAVRGAVSGVALAWAQVFLLSFGFLMAALTCLAARLGARATTAQALATLLAVAMVGNVFFANSLVEAATAERAKMAVIDAVLWGNPWLIVAGSLLEADPLRSENLYSWSVLIYYGFQYPGAGLGGVGARAVLVTCVYAAAGVVALAAGWLIGRRPRPAQ